MRHQIYLALGSNLGDGKANLDRAVALLAQRVGEVQAVSGYMESEPWGFESQHRFTNGAVAMTTSLSPMELLDVTQAIEREMGRTHKHKPGEPYTDRIIDIDILLYDDVHIATERLVIPHPHIHDRDFVRIPLTEISSNKTV